MDKSISEMSYHELLREFMLCSDLADNISDPKHVFYSERADVIKKFIDDNFETLYSSALEDDIDFISNF